MRQEAQHVRNFVPPARVPFSLEAVVRDPGQARVRPATATHGLVGAIDLKLAAAVAAIFLLGSGGLLAVAVVPLGPIARHMCAHIWLMNAIAPALALAIVRFGVGRRGSSALMLAAATVTQMALLWVAHAPTALHAASASAVLHVATQFALFASALWFWSTVLVQRGSDRWLALLALLVSGKLFCLLAVLLVFAPRFFYGDHPDHSHSGIDQLADQHFAGLLMLVICPLSYVAAAVVIATRWLREVSALDAAATATSETASVH
jgi:putative membrane protein